MTHTNRRRIQALLAKKDKEGSKLCLPDMSHGEQKWHGSGCHLYSSNSTAEREAALDMLEGVHGSSCDAGADKGYDTQDFITMCRQMNVTRMCQAEDFEVRRTHHSSYWIPDSHGYENVLRRYLAG